MWLSGPLKPDGLVEVHLPVEEAAGVDVELMVPCIAAELREDFGVADGVRTCVST
jgi:hypothetical protein